MIAMLRREDQTYWLAVIEERISGAVYEMWGPFGGPRQPDELESIREGLHYGDVPELAGVYHTHEEDGDLHEITDGATWERYDASSRQWMPADVYVSYEH